MDRKALVKECTYFDIHRAELVERANGKFASIKGDVFVNFLDTPENAFNDGIQRFANVSCLIKKIAEQDEIVSISPSQ
jgi:hypothetical protein